MSNAGWWHASNAAELHLAVDCNPSRSSHGQQRSSFAMGRGLGNAFAAVAAGLPSRDDAPFSRARPDFDPSRHPTQQNRRLVESTALAIVIGSIAGGTIERRPEKFGRDEAVVSRHGRVRYPGRREHSRGIKGLTQERSDKNAQAISLNPCRTAHKAGRQWMLAWLDRCQQLGCTCLVETCLLQARKFKTCRSSGGDDRSAVAKFPGRGVRRDDIELLKKRGRCAQRYLHAAGNVPGQPAADISAVPGVWRTTIALVDSDR
jgi:hypothetical protein